MHSFYQHHKHLIGVVGSHKVVGYNRAQQFSRWNGLKWGFIVFKMSQNIAKFMAYIINQSSSDFQQDGCLYKPISGIHETQALINVWQA